MKWFLSLSILFCFGMIAAPVSAQQSLIAPGAEVVKLAGGFRFTEGPTASSNGDVYFVDDPNCKIHKWCVTENKVSVFIEESAHANGMYFDKNDHLYVCEGGTGSVVYYTLEGKRTVVANKFGARHFNKPNDLWIDPKGGIYFTDPQYGNNFHIVQDGQHIYYILPDRSKTIRVIETGEGKGFVKPNGIVGTPDGKLLYVADIDGRIVYRYNIQPDGTLTGKHPFASHPVDGMTIDEQGNVYLTALNQEDRNHVVIYNPEGKEIERIRIPEGPSNVCFGGKDFKTLFITAHTGFYAIEMNVRGVNPNRVPKIVKMFPENGAANVDPNISQVYLTFDMPMGSGRAWASNTADGTALDHDPEGGGVFWTADQLTCVATVKLQPNKRYVVYLNIRPYIGFASVAGVPSAGLTYSFETGSGPLDPERRNELAQNLHEKPEK